MKKAKTEKPASPFESFVQAVASVPKAEADFLEAQRQRRLKLARARRKRKAPAKK
jgi:hypothetical protein